MTVVVTGGSGFVGRHLVQRLLAQGRKVRAVVYPDSERDKLKDLDVEVICADVRDEAAVHNALRDADSVYHLAAFISIRMREWPIVESINIGGTRNVVNACLDHGVNRLVHCSSFHALQQKPMNVPLDEDRPLLTSKLKPPYGRSKAGGELEVRRGISEGLDAVIVNPTGIIGPEDHGPSYFGRVLMDIATGKLRFLVNGGCDWVDVRDVVNGMVLAEEHAPTGGKYLLSGHWASLKGISTILKDIVVDIEPPKFVFPLWLAHVAAPFNQLFTRVFGVGNPSLTNAALADLSDNPNVSHERAARELGYTSRPLVETLADALRWYAAHGLIARPLKMPG